MNIQVYEAKILRTKSTPLEKEEINDELRKTLDEMVETMRLANGVGLASNQVDIDRRYFVLEIDEIVKKCINPEILEILDDNVEMEEGCLSIPGIFKRVARPNKIKVRYLDENGNVVEEVMEGLWAKAFQHETDHINGMMFIDRLSPINKSLIRKRLENIKRHSKPREF
ncbi:MULTISPECIES: peptide deformylase [Sneathia]|uniref:peptide deformylase n=1 Tax=Sneathia TaxID=168808 RepID=UPI001865C1B4|nr:MULTISPECIES: peptide deformylase [Sneathia]MBE2989184.1 peptide deformylase [Sneathia sp. DSM 16630]MBE3031118.1 peptide deformylase [Sneathia sp. DSM 16631]MDK9581744.1 peptide deformylase [Sneathia vaginalis]